MALALALGATLAITAVAALLRPPGPVTAGVAVGQPAPAVSGTTLDGQPFDLASLRGRPVILNFWGPTCLPCRDEFPLLAAKLAAHAGDGLAVVGILTFDPPDAARTFISQYGATWPTVDDPSGAFRTAYRVIARPQSYFIDRDGIVRKIQVGEITDSVFETLYATISGGSASPAPSGP